MVIQQSYFAAWEMAFWLSERIPMIVAADIVLLTVVKKSLRLWILCSLPLFLLGLVTIVYFESTALAREEGYDMSQPTVREALNSYIDTGKGDLKEIIYGKKYPPVFGKAEINRYLTQWLGGTLTHNTGQDAEFLPEAYNKGDDWFEATLGEPMVYTSAIYNGPNETMWSAQLNKLEYIAHALGVKPGDKAMEIGCGWGRLANHLASKGAHVTAVTMSSDQLAYGKRMTEKLGNTKSIDFVLKNFFDVDYPAKSYNVISAVEMAEHVGIKNYHKFLRKVHYLLADDGVFYIQVAGLQRGYAEGYNNYKELIWGLFMDEHIFPGADASTPMGWVVTKLEQAGFEVQSALNLGWHYWHTINHWRQLWISKKDSIVKVYGERSFRRWEVFLTWTLSLDAGGSTIHFITATKAGNVPARSGVQKRIAPGGFQLPDPTPCPGGGPDP